MPLSKRHQLLIVVAAGLVALAISSLLLWTTLRSWWPRPTPQSVVLVVAAAPGYSGEELETLVAAPLEEQLAGAPPLRSLQTVSSEGVVTASCAFDALVDETASAEAVRHRIRTEALPADVRVEVVRLSAGVGELAHYEVTHDTLALVELRRLHDQELRSALERLPGVERIDECGIGDPEVRVGLDPMRLRGFGLTPTKVRSELERFLGTQGTEDQGSEGLRNVKLGDGPGGPVRLSDVAAIRIGTAPHRCVCEVQGKPGLCVSVRGRGAGGAPGSTAAAVREKIRQWSSETSPGMQLHMSAEDKTVTKLELWPTGAIGADSELEAARAVTDALKSSAGGLEAVVQVGAPEGSWPGALVAGGQVEIRGCDPGTAAGIQASVAAAIEKAAPWLRVSPAGEPAPVVTEAVIRGPELAQLARVARELRDKVAGAPDVRQALVLGIGQRAGLDVHLDRDRAAMLGVQIDEVAWIARLAFGGQVLHASLLPLREPLAVRLELANVGKEPDQLATLSVPTASGSSVPLSAVAEIRMRSRPDPILREDRQRAVVLRVWGPSDPRRGWRDDVVHAGAQVKLPVGYSIAWRNAAGE